MLRSNWMLSLNEWSRKWWEAGYTIIDNSHCDNRGHDICDEPMTSQQARVHLTDHHHHLRAEALLSRASPLDISRNPNLQGVSGLLFLSARQ